MKHLAEVVDRLLRGAYTEPSDLRKGEIGVPMRPLIVAGVVLGVVYGACMGIYGVTRARGPSWAQLGASTVKFPMLFLATLAVTLPSLYVFSALNGSRLRFRPTLRLLLSAITVNLAVLASFGPVLGFFTFSTQSYPFMVLLNVAFCGVAGLIGLAFLRRALAAIFTTEDPPAPPPPPPRPPEPSYAVHPPLEVRSSSDDGPSLPFDPSTRRVMPMPPPRRPPPVDPGRGVFRVWTLIFGIVGAQMGWILRPFIGAPDQPFTMFRPRQSNFFEAVAHALRELLR